MGLSQSKAQQEPIVFINPNVPVQVMTSKQLQINNKTSARIKKKNAEQTVDTQKNRQIESLVQARVNKELEKMKLAEGEISSTLAAKESTAIKSNLDLTATIKKIERANSKEVPTSIKKQQDKLVACYKENQNKSLNCWQQALDFKHAVLEEQKKVISRAQ